MNLSHYRKAVVEIAFIVAYAFLTAMTDDTVTLAEAIGLGLLLLRAILVYLIKNQDTGAWKYAKFIVSTIIAVVVSVQLSILDGFQVDDAMAIIIALAGSFGVVVTPNEPELVFATPQAITEQ